MTSVRFPVGRFAAQPPIGSGERARLIESLAEVPAKLQRALAGLDNGQLDTPYREEGWTLRQVAHHLPDSHVNGYVRFRLALTEALPTIKPYVEGKWAQLEDARLADPEVSLRLLEALHERWTMLLKSLPAEQFGRSLNHPEMGVMSIDEVLQLYEWHGRHHVAHITSLRKQMAW
ncbi:MAG: YfiT family bacillithiol transferase [Acidobacteriota bacterium]